MPSGHDRADVFAPGDRRFWHGLFRADRVAEKNFLGSFPRLNARCHGPILERKGHSH